MATLLFIIPTGKGDGEKLMDWGKCRKLQWHIILLLGAAFAIAEGFKASGLTDMATTLVLPLFAELGNTSGVHPLLLMVLGTVSAQLSYLLPTASPPNVVGFGIGYITIKDMVLTGIPLKVVGVATLAVLLAVPRLRRHRRGITAPVTTYAHTAAS